jgi:serine/threonine protein kinase
MTGAESDWPRVSQVVAEALERPLAEREAFLTGACAGDARLRAEVESLLEAHARAGSRDFLERPAAALMPELLEDEPSGLVGRRVGHYLIRSEIGRGGMGVVFLAEDMTLGREVALKAVPAELGRDPRTRERLRREARSAAALSHPAIATVYALEEADGELFIASEYVRGHTLRQEISAGALPADEVIATARQVAAALAAAHARGIVHRDLKPENVLRREDGQIKVLDFGLARLIAPSGSLTPAPTHTFDSVSLPGAIVGTPGYMAPEQLRGGNVDARADVFAFGVLLHELATGTHPFGDARAATPASGPEQRTPKARAPFPLPWLEPLLQRCLASRPEDRFASGVELLDALSTTEAFSTSDITTPEVRLGWWRFHQAAISLFHAATLVGLWLVRDLFPRPWGNVVFYVALTAQTAAVTMRLHLWFASRVHPDLLAGQRARVSRAIILLDLVHGGLLLVTAIEAANADAASAPLFIVAAIVSLLALALIEPATTRAAFRRPEQRS